MGAAPEKSHSNSNSLQVCLSLSALSLWSLDSSCVCGFLRLVQLKVNFVSLLLCVINLINSWLPSESLCN